MSRPDHTIENRASKSYIAEYSAPKLELENIHQFKNDTQNNLNNKIKARLGDLQKEYKELEELYHYNIFIDGFDHNFIPVAGHTYYLYDHEGHKFLSLIEPENFLLCKNSCVGKCRYNGLGFFENER
ncbi:hypothetical protein EBR43_04680 [bacterium]|nr:hypothetical protein [bacterium]